MPTEPSTAELLVDPDWLSARLGSPMLRAFDCTGRVNFDRSPLRPEGGHDLYRRGHIPETAYLDLLRLAAPGDTFYPLLTPEEFSVQAGRLGIGPDHHVVLYSAQRPSWATRAWWLLRLHGHRRVSVLQGGWEGWVRSGGPVALNETVFPATTFRSEYRPELLATETDVQHASTLETSLIVGSLSEGQFAGDEDGGYVRRGRIPSSIRLRYTDLLDATHTAFLAKSALKKRLPASPGHIVTYCVGGVGATALSFAWALLGKDVAVYNGSMLEWAKNPENPIARGS
ncbi:MAG: rhodanese-like domain-containing protein [Myxococcota bacterium]